MGVLKVNIAPAGDLGDIAVIDQEARPLDSDQVEQLRELFNFFDLDGKSKITAGSLKQLFAEIGLTYSLAQCGAIIAKHGNAFGQDQHENKEPGGPQLAGVNSGARGGEPKGEGKKHKHNPGIAFEDFLVFFADATRSWSSAKEIKEIFRVLDDDGDGWVEVRKLKTMWRGLQPNKTAQQVMDEINTALQDVHLSANDQGRKMNFDQFVRFLFNS
jgi:Ca2+-binding EF-hand superfamily protein